MDREGLSKVKRAELLARLEALNRLIIDQQARVALLRGRGWHATEAEKQLELLNESHKLYLSALTHMLGENFRGADGEADPEADGDAPPA